MTSTVSSQSISNFFDESDCEKQEEESEVMSKRSMRREDDEDDDEIADVAQSAQCIIIHKRQSSKRGEELSHGKYGLWRQEQRARAARLQKQLKAKWQFEELINEQLNRFHAHYNCAMIPTRLKDVPQLLMPKWAAPHELATFSWFGDWRPSMILELLRVLARASSSSSFSSPLSSSNGLERRLSQLTKEIRIEEVIIDEEMTEIQATCAFHLSFSPVNNHQSSTTALSSIQDEFKKIAKVITKAQQLRFKALEMVVKKVLSETDAAEFLVAFAGIQDAIHQFASKQKLRKGPVTAPLKALGPP